MDLKKKSGERYGNTGLMKGKRQRLMIDRFADDVRAGRPHDADHGHFDRGRKRRRLAHGRRALDAPRAGLPVDHRRRASVQMRPRGKPASRSARCIHVGG